MNILNRTSAQGYNPRERKSHDNTIPQSGLEQEERRVSDHPLFDSINSRNVIYLFPMKHNVSGYVQVQKGDFQGGVNNLQISGSIAARTLKYLRG